MISRFRVTLYRETDQEMISPDFISSVLPYPGLRVLHGTQEWELTKVRLHVRSENSIAALNDEPHLVDVLAVEVEGLFA